MKKAIASLALVLAFPAAALAREQDRPTTPGDRGHILKLTREMVKLGTTKDHSAKTELFLRLADERMKELHAMEASGKKTHHAALGRSYDLMVRRGAAGSIENGVAGGKDMRAAMDRYAEAVNRHQDAWSRFVNRVPEGERGAFLRALEASRHGREDALRAHQQGLKLQQERRLMRERGRPVPKPPPKPDGKKSWIPPPPRPREIERSVHPRPSSRPQRAIY